MKTNFLNYKTMKTTKIFASAFIALSLLASCSDDDDDAPEQAIEEEVVTDVRLIFVNTTDATDTVTLEIIDTDGEDGPAAPVESNPTSAFTAGQTYTASVELFNSIEGEDITEEVTVDLPNEHFFTYATTLGVDFTRSANDIVRTNDDQSMGFRTTWVANTAGTGTITLRLVHLPTTVDDSDEFGSVTGGSTDVDVTFTGVVIE